MRRRRHLLLDNRTSLAGSLIEMGSLRYTPAGIPALNFHIAHSSTQEEAGVARKVECEMACVTLGSTAQLLAGVKPGTGVRLSGFLAAKSLKSRTPVLHVDTIEFLEG